ncbi:Zinc finger BED domain-containing protein RICESLEEPER 2, partial [Linum grandiflorum]
MIVYWHGRKELIVFLRTARMKSNSRSGVQRGKSSFHPKPPKPISKKKQVNVQSSTQDSAPLIQTPRALADMPIVGQRVEIRVEAQRAEIPTEAPTETPIGDELVDMPNRKRSKVWDNFRAVLNSKGQHKALCKHCGSLLAAHPTKNGITSLGRHTTSCKKKRDCTNGRQMRLKFQPDSDGTVALGNWQFNQTRVRKKVAEMIILDELPFRFVEKEGFNGLMKEACPMFKMPSRRTIREDCLKLFLDEKDKLITYFASKCRGRVSLTTDCWTSIQNLNYLCLTAHFIGEDWKLHKKILSFPRIYSHKGYDIASVVAACLEEWNILSVFSITVDNASSNDTAIFHLNDIFKKWGTQLLDGKYVHMRCIAHITNLTVGYGLEEVAMSVRRVCEAVRYVRSSPTRWAQFKECVSLQRIQSKKLVCLDVATRWNSTYLMLEVAVAFENSFVSYESVDFEFK